MKKVVIIIVVGILVFGGLFMVRQKKEQIQNVSVRPARTVVRTETVRPGNLAVTRTYLARVEPGRTGSLTARVVAPVLNVFVREGDRVVKGQILVALDDKELRAAIRGAEAAVARGRMQVRALSATIGAQEKTVRFLQREVDRDEILAREGALALVVAESSAERLSEARGRLESLRETAEATRREVEMQERELEKVGIRAGYAEISAPFDGVVSRRTVDPGDMAGPSRTMLVVEDHSLFRVRFDVPQAELAGLEPGMTVRGPDLRTAVSRILPALNADRTVTVECDVANGALRSGVTLPVNVVLNVLENEVLVSETGLVPSPEGGQVVFAVEDGVLVPRPVTVLGKGDGVVAVQGVRPGTEVVLSSYLGWNRLAAGEPVEVLP
jgi:RND family efflux transporter MFP subunit